jgi:hypothetical protein
VSATGEAITQRQATELADALWWCHRARREEYEARQEAAVPDSWDYFGASYFREIERADEHLAAVLTDLGLGSASPRLDGCT